MNIMNNFLNTSATISSANSTVVAANGGRRFLCLVNDSDTVIYVSLGTPARVNKGIRLNALGGSFMMDDRNLYQGIITGITTSTATGLKYLTVCEGTP